MTEGEVAISVVSETAAALDVSDVVTASRDVDDDEVIRDEAEEDAFLAGFRDCRREALRYVRQRGDMEVGEELERHLAAVERTLRQRISSAPHHDEHHGGLVGTGSQDDSALGVSLLDDELADDTSDHEHGQSASASEVTSSLSENAYDLLRLAQNNPRINNVLNELFTLMDDDDDDDCGDDCDCSMTCDDDAVTLQQPASSRDVMTSHDTVTDVS